VLPPSLTVTDPFGVKSSMTVSAEGIYSIGLAPGTYSVTAGAQPPAVASAPVELAAAEPSKQLDLELVSVAPIRIRVKCGEDNPDSLSGLAAYCSLCGWVLAQSHAPIPAEQCRTAASIESHWGDGALPATTMFT